ncbi:MAG: ribonuclease J [Bacilli bacterium]|nr:ribonuclease J [Bacilli bacterium]
MEQPIIKENAAVQKSTDEIKIIALGGLGENGKNTLSIEVNGQIFILDAGVKYPSRSTPGIEYVIANYEYLKRNKDKIQGYVISHAHYYNYAAIPYIIDDCPAPIYCTEVTKFFLEYFIKKNNLRNENIIFHVIKPSDKIKIGNTNFVFFPTCHNVPGSVGISIETNLGNIVYIGDFIIENNNLNNFNMYSSHLFDLTKQNTLLLMSSSLFAFRNGYTSPNNRLTPLIENLFDNTKRIIIALSAENIYGLLEVIRLATLCNYKLFAYDNETFNFWEKFKVIPDNNIPNGIFLQKNINSSDTSSLLIMLGDERAIYNKLKFLHSENKNGFNFLSVKTVFVLALSTDKNNELPHSDMLNNLYKIKVDIVDISKKYLEMLPSKEDLKNMLYLFKPKYYLPINGNFFLLTLNAQLAFQTGFLTHQNIFILENGLGIIISKNNVGVFKEKQDVFLIEDGKKISSNIVNERILISKGGMIIVSAIIDKAHKKIISKPEITLVGCNIYENLQSINNEVVNIINNCFKENKNISESIYYGLKRKLSKDDRENSMIILPIVIDKSEKTGDKYVK